MTRTTPHGFDIINGKCAFCAEYHTRLRSHVRKDEYTLGKSVKDVYTITRDMSVCGACPSAGNKHKERKVIGTPQRIGAALYTSVSNSIK